MARERFTLGLWPEMRGAVTSTGAVVISALGNRAMLYDVDTGRTDFPELNDVVWHATSEGVLAGGLARVIRQKGGYGFSDGTPCPALCLLVAAGGARRVLYLYECGSFGTLLPCYYWDQIPSQRERGRVGALAAVLRAEVASEVLLARRDPREAVQLTRPDLDGGE